MIKKNKFDQVFKKTCEKDICGLVRATSFFYTIQTSITWAKYECVVESARCHEKNWRKSRYFLNCYLKYKYSMSNQKLKKWKIERCFNIYNKEGKCLKSKSWKNAKVKTLLINKLK